MPQFVPVYTCECGCCGKLVATEHLLATCKLEHRVCICVRICMAMKGASVSIPTSTPALCPGSMHHFDFDSTGECCSHFDLKTS